MKELTAKQRVALETLEAAKAAGQGLCAYARAHGLDARRLHDGVAQLRRRGVLPPVRGAGEGASAFVAVRFEDSAPVQRGGMVCRVLHPRGLVIECGEWPPAAWLMSLTSGHRDAAS